MPLPLRKVEPTYVCRGTLPEKINVPNDLEAVANGTLAHVILQLSSLSHNAEEMFSDLVRVATDISSRSASLQARLDRLAVKVNQLDGTQDECSMQDCLNTKPFQSSTGFDQQVVARTSMPTGMAHRYTKCDRPPPLEKLNGYRDDGKDGLKFYTDPNYFFELWRQEMLKDTEKAVRKPHKPKGEGGRGHKKRVRQPVNTREKQKNMAIQHGEHFVEPTQIRAAAATPNKPLDVGDGIIYPPEMPKKASRPNSMEIKRVSFEGVDRDDEEHPEGLTHANQYAVPHVHSKHDVVHVLPHAFVHPNEIKLARDKMAARNNNNAYLNNNNNNNNVTDNNTRRSWGSGTVFIVNGRRSSDSSDNSVKMNARRPSQPPPAPPSAPPSSSSSPGSSIPSNGGTPTARTNNIRVMKEVRETLPPPPPPPAEAEINGNGVVRGSVNNNYPLPPAMIRPSSAALPPPPPTAATTLEDNEDDLPPPPPTPDQIRAEHIIMNADLPAAPAHLRVSIDDSSSHNLPPAPPPPMSESPVPPPPPPPLLPDSPSPSKAGEIGVVLQGAKKANNKKKVVTVPVADGRDELLQAIRGGICLRKVDVKVKVTKEEKVNSTYGDVASILARRVALEMSDSDSGSSEYDSDGWDETSA